MYVLFWVNDYFFTETESMAQEYTTKKRITTQTDYKKGTTFGFSHAGDEPVACK